MSSPGPDRIDDRDENAGPAEGSSAPGGVGSHFAASLLLPLGVAAVAIAVWHVAVAHASFRLVPSPRETALGIAQLVQDGLLWKYVTASLFRVMWGFGLAAAAGVPFGLLMGWYWPVNAAFNPLFQALRQISPIAWTPLAIIWFGVDDASPIFLIFLASFFPITVTAAAAVRNVHTVHLRAAHNFGLRNFQLLRHVILPATMPQIVTGLRISLGIAWLVIVAAEMTGNSGLGYLITDSRNSGRYDLVVAGMVVIGLIGLLLDMSMRQFERHPSLQWAYGSRVN